MEFEYDPSKSELNREKHGIDFEQAKALWAGRVVEAKLPYDDETRWLVIGMIDGKHYSAVITYRADTLRLISVRRSRTQERRLYDGE